MFKAYLKDDFKDISDYLNWVKATSGTVSNKNKIWLSTLSDENVSNMLSDRPEWFGEGTTLEELKSGITTYKNPELLDKIYEKVQDSVSIEVRSKIKSRKVRYNSTGIGIFCFDRASMGLFRIKEYYSPSLRAIVDKNNVYEKESKFYLKKDNSSVIERWEEKNDARPKVRTNSKKVFAYYPKLKKSKRSVHIYISCGGSANRTAEQFLYSGTSAIIVAQLLQKSSIPVKISLVIGTSPNNFKKSVFASIIPIKHYDEKIDANLIALLTSDPRFYRYDGFKGIVSTYNHFGEDLEQNLGYGFNDRDLLRNTIENENYKPSVPLSQNRIYMGRIFSEEEAIADITSVINELAQKIEDND